MALPRRLFTVALIACAFSAWGQSNPRNPHIGYLYPAGGQQGTVIKITIGGQWIRGARAVHISGEGVSAKVIQTYRPIRNIKKEERDDLQKRMKEVRDKRVAELSPKERAAWGLRTKPGNVKRKKSANKPKTTKKTSAPKKDATTKNTDVKKKTETPKKAPFRPVEHPLLYGLEDKSLRELEHINYYISFPRWMRQDNAQLGETALLEVAIDAGAAPGDRELRIETPAGLTNPMVFQVGLLPELCELEPNPPKTNAKLPPPPALDLPVLLNGQIMPGDVDRFRFRAQQGQQLVLETQARHLLPYLADTVPGWFQATLALYDAQGREVAFADDYRFDPDPVLFYEIPEDGEYEIEIRDSIYRGREDFVYRIALGELPFITQAFPLGGQTGAETTASITGWNLAKAKLPLDTTPDGPRIRQAALQQKQGRSNQILYAVDTLREIMDKEPNDNIKKAQRIRLPRIVNGRIGQPGDVDVFRFKGRAGDEIVAEVYGRRLHSPLDSVLRLTDATGHVIEWNDDHEDKEAGLLTHHADSYLRARLPEKGKYYVSLADAQHQGGPAYAYRLRIGAPQPDFALRVTPSSISVPAGHIVPISVYAFRKDGFDGDIEIGLNDAPPGFALNGGRIPSGRDCVCMTLTAPRQRPEEPVVLRLEGRAQIDGETIRRPVAPAEDMMQAFLYRHLAPSQELMVAVAATKRNMPKIEVAGGGTVRIPAGGAAQVQVTTSQRPALKRVELELRDPPQGVTLHDMAVVPDGLSFTLKADGDAIQAGFEDNLIVEAFTKTAVPKKGGKTATQKRRVSLGVLPAIPFEIVQP